MSTHVSYKQPLTDDAATFDDSIASLMRMAEKMDALLPPDVSLDLFHTPFAASVSAASVSAASASAMPVDAHPDVCDLALSDGESSGDTSYGLALVDSPHAMADAFAHAPPVVACDVMHDACEAYIGRDCTTSLTLSIAPDALLGCNPSPTCVRTAAVTAPSAAPAAPIMVPTTCRSASTTSRSPGTPCANANGSPTASVVIAKKSRKATRKPKTYAKPVASRFCHICSRMPRRGQGSAVCRRMRDGYCRKIVCEQCMREQGWDYDAVALRGAAWLCPHCADVCPARSQCHIYNRINARRKRDGPAKDKPTVASGGSHGGGGGASGVGGGASGGAMAISGEIEVAAAAAAFAQLVDDVSDDMGTGRAVGAGSGQMGALLQPPPNFRLNLPAHYSGL